MLNIGGENNAQLKSACRVLREYGIYTDLIRTYINEGLEIAEVVEAALEECIKTGALKEFLTKHRAKAKAVSIFEYDQEKHLKMEREETWACGKAEGVREGIEKGIEQGIERGIEKGITEGGKRKTIELIQMKLAKGKTVSQIAEELEEDEALIREIINLYREYEKICNGFFYDKIWWNA